MAVALFLISIVLGILFLVSLIIPKKVVFFSDQPTRGKGSLYYGIPFLILLVLSMVIAPDRLEEALRDGDRTSRLSLSNKGIDQLPEEVATLINLEKLDLSNNNFSEVPEMILELKKLEELDLSGNPVTTLPEWINEHPSLKKIDLSDTKLSERPSLKEGISLSYEDTPLFDKEMDAAKESVKESSDEKIASAEGEAESFSDYAIRRLLGQDYGFKRKFLKSEIYYDHPVTKEKVDEVGRFFVTLKYFNEQNAVSVLLEQNDDETYILKMVIDESQLEAGDIETFGEIRTWLKERVFSQDSLYLQLIDEDLELIKEIRD